MSSLYSLILGVGNYFISLFLTQFWLILTQVVAGSKMLTAT